MKLVATSVSIPILSVSMFQPASADSEPELGSAADYAQAKAIRESAGLPADQATITQSFNSPLYSSETAGIPLTDDEAALFITTVADQVALFPALEKASGRDDFAGAYFDGSVLTVATTGDTKAVLSTVTSAAPARAELNVVEVVRSQPELEGIQRAIGESLADLASQGIDVKLVGIDPRRNVVEVGVLSALSAAKEYFAAKFGDAVAVYAEAKGSGSLLVCSRDDCGTKGGLGASKNGVTCTTAFLMKYLSTRYMLTAGHCITDTGGTSSTSSWRNPAGTVTWGRSFDYDFSPPGLFGGTTYNDLGVFRLGSASASVWNYYFGGSSSFILTVTSRVYRSNQVPGLFVCRHGYTSSWDCGTINRSRVSVTISCGILCGLTLSGTYEVTLKSQHGDSGAGFLVSTHGALGVLSAGDQRSGIDYTYYFDLQGFDGTIYSFAPVAVCTTSGC